MFQTQTLKTFKEKKNSLFFLKGVFVRSIPAKCVGSSTEATCSKIHRFDFEFDDDIIFFYSCVPMRLSTMAKVFPFMAVISYVLIHRYLPYIRYSTLLMIIRPLFFLR